jgi:hypothetical protein
MSRLLAMAGFEVTLYGRFWVISEVESSRNVDAGLTASGISQGEPMTRQVLVVIGAAVLSIFGFGLIGGLVWLWLSVVHGTPQYVLEARFRIALYVLPALLAAAAFIGASLMAHSLAARRRQESRKYRDLT